MIKKVKSKNQITIISILSLILVTLACNKSQVNKFLTDKYALAKSSNKDNMSKAIEFEKGGISLYKDKQFTKAIIEYEKALELFANGSIYYM